METHSPSHLRLVEPTKVDLHQRLAGNDQAPPRIGDVLLGLFDVAVEFVTDSRFFVGAYVGCMLTVVAALAWSFAK